MRLPRFDLAAGVQRVTDRPVWLMAGVSAVLATDVFASIAILIMGVLVQRQIDSRVVPLYREPELPEPAYGEDPNAARS